ncbi:MAG: SpoIVB peptidase [Oscillospiraceae bacterium]|jgi:stage IV sporulation protein B|nr:SpoIVB peptidase [Oscillospiraceae bacterium]
MVKQKRASSCGLGARDKRNRVTRQAVSLLLALVFICTAGFGAMAVHAENLVPVGRTVGISLESDGVVVVGVPEKCSDDMTASPARAAGFKAGDIIVRLGANIVKTCLDLKDATTRNGDTKVAVHVLRGGVARQLEITPVKTANGEFSLGVWVRDGISGIGTVTFYNPETGQFGALGHSVSDSETGVLIPVRSGSISRASVSDVAKGKTGAPGQLHGQFSFDDKLGEVLNNTQHGIFGTARGAFDDGPVFETATESEIHTGDAYILSNVAGTEVRRYTIEVTRVYKGGESDERSMLVTVTDPELIEATGGIVQGMSGSPIIQDGKIIGAVTHVLINDPTKGYATSIEKMLASAVGINA